MGCRPWIRRILRGLGLGAALAFGGFAAGALITDRLEQDNRFCIACHAPAEVTQERRIKGSKFAKLHQEKYDRFSLLDGKTISLAGSHNVKARVKCIDCHIGADVRDYLIVKAISAKDTGKYLLGRFREPPGLTYPLGDGTCLKCHPDGGRNPKDPNAFHNAPYHRDLRNGCSACHPSHAEAAADTRFLQRELVKPLCDACHMETLGIKGTRPGS